MWNETGAPRREGMTRSIRSLAAAMSPSCVAAASTAWNTASMLPAASVSKRARAALVSVTVSSLGRPRPRCGTTMFGLGGWGVSHVRTDLDTRIKYDVTTRGASPHGPFSARFREWSGVWSGVFHPGPGLGPGSLLNDSNGFRGFRGFSASIALRGRAPAARATHGGGHFRGATGKAFSRRARRVTTEATPRP